MNKNNNMKRSLLLFPLLCLMAAPVLALPVFHPAGPNLTYGAVSHAQTLIANVQNPAAGAVALERGNRYGFGLPASAGAGFEVGPIDNLADELDALSEAVDQRYESLSEAEATIDRFNGLLQRMGVDGYLKVGAAANVPLAAANDTFGGSIAIDADYSFQRRLAVLDEPLRYNPQSKDIETPTALYLKGADIEEYSLAYSRPIQAAVPGGRLYGGARAKILVGTLMKNVVGVKNLSGDTMTVFETDSKKNASRNDAFGVDLGLLWVADHYRAGVTLTNLNTPSLRYRTIGSDCGTDADCETARAFAHRIALAETHAMDPQGTLEAALYNQARTWLFAAAMDANAIHDPVGDEVQFVTLSAAYTGDGLLLPGYRFGYRKNLAGSALSYVTAGLTLLKVFNFDIAYGLEAVTISDERYPRGLMMNVGLEISF